MSRRLAAVLAVTALTVAAPPASASQVEVCVRSVTLTFTPPLSLVLSTGGVVTRDVTSVCVRTTDGSAPYSVAFSASSSGVYVGNCLRTEIAGDFSMTLVGGAGGVLTRAGTDYAVADVLVLVPDEVCNVGRANGVEAGPGIWP